jgi:hypothetical protein
MHAIYAFGIFVLIALLGTRFLYRGKNPFSPLYVLLQSGLVYVFLGVYLGQKGVNILSPQILQGFHPIIGLGLGWIGFLFGFQLEYRYLKRFPKKYLSLSLAMFLIVFFLTAAIMFRASEILFREFERYLLYGLAVAFGFLASVHSPTLLNTLSFKFPKRGHHYYLARFLVSIGSFWGIVGLAVLSGFWHFPFLAGGVFLKGVVLLLASTLVPILLGYLFHLITKGKCSEQDLLVYLLGLVFFMSGAAFYFNLLPLYVCMVMGIAFSNLTKRHEKIYPVLLSTEKPLYITLLILVGALWEVRLDSSILWLVVIFLCLRLLGHVLFLPFFQRVLRFPFILPCSFGFCLFSVGGIGIAFAVSLKIAYPLPLTEVFFSVALLAILLGEFLSPWAARFSFFRLDKKA